MMPMDVALSVKVGSYVPQTQPQPQPQARTGTWAPATPTAPAQPRDEYIPSIPQIPQIPPPVEAKEVSGDVKDNEKDNEKDNVNDNVNDEKDKDNVNDAEFTPEEQKIIADLKARDKQVRDHEQAHISAGGPYITGGASYEYERGPDDKRYAVGGEVGIDTSPIRDNPEATIAKMQVVRAAAMAPADPSAQDGAVAAEAARTEAVARVELSEKRAAEAEAARANADAARAASAYAKSQNLFKSN